MQSRRLRGSLLGSVLGTPPRRVEVGCWLPKIHLTTMLDGLAQKTPPRWWRAAGTANAGRDHGIGGLADEVFADIVGKLIPTFQTHGSGTGHVGEGQETACGSE
jgi:hypothetical protein